MIESLGYPASGFVVEQLLSAMPHLKQAKSKFPLRRADIVFFAKGIHPHNDLHPLLLIECKAAKLNAAAINQVIGYNYHLQACSVAVANDQQIKTGFYSTKEQGYRFIDGLPSYEALLIPLRQLQNS